MVAALTSEVLVVTGTRTVETETVWVVTLAGQFSTEAAHWVIVATTVL